MLLLQIRAFVEADWREVWPIVREVVRAADTFAYDPAMTEAQARAAWIEAPPGLTVVAVERRSRPRHRQDGPEPPRPRIACGHGELHGGGRCARARGGDRLCRFALDWAREHGFAGMQFNAVVETNHAAIEIYQRLGFTIIGTVPGAFAHPTQGRVGLHIMYREL